MDLSTNSRHVGSSVDNITTLVAPRVLVRENLEQPQLGPMASMGRAEPTLSLRMFVLLLLVTSSLSSVQSEENGLQSTWSTELSNGWEADVATSPINYWSQRRALLQEAAAARNSTGPVGRRLAVKYGRLDPFNGFRKYRGGYDVESKHYWGSVVFTGIFGYALAAAWLLIGLILALSLCCMRYCWKRKFRARAASVDPPRLPYCGVAVSSVVVLSVGALGCCVALYVGSSNFTVEARNVEGTLSRAADNASDTIGNITMAITKVQQLLEPYESSGSTLEIGNTKARLTNESQSIQETVDDNTDIFHKIITAMEATVIVLTTLNLIGVIMGLVSAVWGWRRIFYFIVVASWILTILNAFFFGLYFMFNKDSISFDLLLVKILIPLSFLHRQIYVHVRTAVKDTCDAMNEYKDQPYNTTLDALLPCEDLLSARGAVVDVAKEVRNSLIQVNDTLNSVQQLLGTTLTPLCEQIGPSPDYQYISTCPNNTVTIGEIPKLGFYYLLATFFAENEGISSGIEQELEPLRCSSNDSVSCYQQLKFLTDSDYQKVIAYAGSAQILLSTYPTVNRLTNCSIVVHAFSELLNDSCGPANSALRVVWISFLVLALIMIFLVLSWLVFDYPKTKRKLWRTVAPQEMPVWTDQTSK